MENQSIPLANDFKEMFELTKRLFVNGRYAIYSLRYFFEVCSMEFSICIDILNITLSILICICSYKEHNADDVKNVCVEIKNLKNVLQR